MSRHLGVLALVFAVAGCAGVQSPIATPGTPANPATVSAPKRGASWMAPQAQKTASLLYVSNWGTSDVTVYTYANGGGLVLVGTLTGFSLPGGLCTDSAGNVWIPDTGGRRVFEYAHGGTKPIQTIQLSTGYPYACAVDSATGNVAVSSAHPNGKYQAYSIVDVFSKGSRRPARYSTLHGFKNVYFVAYDDKSNLYADATPCEFRGCYYRQEGPPGFYKLSSGGSDFKRLTLVGAKLHEPAAIDWVKPALLLGDRDFEDQGTSGAYKVFVSGSKATVVATLPFGGTQQAYGFSRRATRVIVPDFTGNAVRVYDLSNGLLISTLTTKISEPFSTVVSQ